VSDLHALDTDITVDLNGCRLVTPRSNAHFLEFDVPGVIVRAECVDAHTTLSALRAARIDWCTTGALEARAAVVGPSL
jgi:hypothetical protein